MASTSAAARGAPRPRGRKPAAARAKTKWGDREGRRRDILDAARAQIAGGGYLALNMRDLAAGAGVSPGTLYSYFATKEEIFATLYAEAIEQHNERIAPICAAPTGLESFLNDIATAYLDLYSAYGRYFTMWEALQGENRADDSPLPVELREDLRAATVHQGQTIAEGLRRAAAADGVELTDEPELLTFLWFVMNGLGDHVTTGRSNLSPFTQDQLIAYAAKTIAAGITR